MGKIDQELLKEAEEARLNQFVSTVEIIVGKMEKDSRHDGLAKP